MSARYARYAVVNGYAQAFTKRTPVRRSSVRPPARIVLFSNGWRRLGELR